jgi:hypothetical protein
MYLNNIILRKEARHKRPQIRWLHLYELSRTDRSIETKKQIGGCQGLGGCGHEKRLMSMGFLFQ